jgi:hypothetical protein
MISIAGAILALVSWSNFAVMPSGPGAEAVFNFAIFCLILAAEKGPVFHQCLTGLLLDLGMFVTSSLVNTVLKYRFKTSAIFSSSDTMFPCASLRGPTATLFLVFTFQVGIKWSAVIGLLCGQFLLNFFLANLISLWTNFSCFLYVFNDSVDIIVIDGSFTVFFSS